MANEPLTSNDYVISQSALIAVLELDTAAIAPTLGGLSTLANDSRLHTVSLAWNVVKDDTVEAAFQSNLSTFVIRELDLEVELIQVLDACSDVIIGNNPTAEDPEPWLLALALRRNAILVSEPSALSRLPTACPRMGVQLEALQFLLATEGIP